MKAILEPHRFPVRTEQNLSHIYGLANPSLYFAVVSVPPTLVNQQVPDVHQLSMMSIKASSFFLHVAERSTMTNSY